MVSPDCEEARRHSGTGIHALSIGLLRSQEYSENQQSSRLVIKCENDSVCAHAAPKDAFPFATFEGFHVALERTGSQLLQRLGHPLLNAAGQFPQVFLGIRSELTGPIHA